jgi:predicted dehydrogenase
MSYRTSRRQFLKASAALTASVGAARFTALSYANILGANSDIRIGVIGFNGRGNAHIDAWRKMAGVRLVALCDADESVLNKGYARVMAAAPTSQPDAATGVATKARVEKYSDARKLLDNKDIDAVSTATPNHWHSLITVWGCQAGKDVYVEKPVSHDVWDGRKSVEAARKYNRIVQAGTQNRTNPAARDAVEFVHKGNLGKVLIGRALVYNRRGSIGKITEPPKVPQSVNLDLWCGPSPLEAPHRKNFHYDWHWFWQTGNGEIGNNCIHEIDIVRWFMQKQELSPSVISVGGRLGYEDDAETPNTQFAVHNYGDSLMVMEIRGLPTKPGSPKVDTYKGQSIGWVIECEKGYVAGSSAYDKNDKLIQSFEPDAKAKKAFHQDHFVNFIDAVRSRKVSDLHADIEQGHLSSGLCHTPNISYRLGQKADPDAINEAMKADPAALDAFERLKEHLATNEVDMTKDKLALGMPLKMDPKTERFIGNEKANEMLKRVYRAPFVIPENV